MNLNYLFKALLRKKLLLIFIPLLTLVSAFLLTINLKDQYKSRAQLATGFTISDQVRVSNEKIDEPESEAKFNNVLETLASPKVIGYVSYALMIHDLTDKVPFVVLSNESLHSKEFIRVNKSRAIKTLKTHLDSLTLLNSYVQEEKDLIEFLKLYGYDYDNLSTKILKIYRVQRTDFIDIYATTENPELSAFIVNTVCSQFLKYNNIVQSERTVASVEAFRKLLAQKKLQVAKISDSLRNFKSSHGVLDLASEGRSKNDLIKEYSASLTEEEQSNYSYKLELQNIIKQLRDLGDNPGPKVKNAPNNQDILDLRQKIDQLMVDQQSKSVNDPRLNKKISDLNAQLTEKISQLNDETENPAGNTPGISEHDRLLQRKNDLEVKVAASDRAISEYQSKIRTLNASYGTYASKEAINNSLQKEYDMAAQEYNNADEKYNQAVNQKFAAYNENIKQSLFGQPAVDPEPSKRLLIILIAGVTSFFLFIFIIILTEYMDASIKTPFIFSKEVDIPLLGVINRVNLKKENLENVLLHGSDSGKINPEFKDFIKKIRFELDQKNCKIFLFTSNKAGEGKTTVIISLSQVLSSINKRLLLIDTNFSNNSLTRHFGCEVFLEDMGDFKSEGRNEFPGKMIGKTINPNIDVIGCKGGNYSPSEIFLQKGFLNALNNLSIYYDYIFMEGANLNQYADSKELAQFSEGVVAVFSARSVIKQNDTNSINFLKGLGDKFSGAILNNVELENIDF